MDQKQQFSIRAWGYHIHFDGDMLTGKPVGTLFSRPRLEIPVNIILDYQLKSVLKVSRLDLYINSYSYGQATPDIRSICPIYFMLKQASSLSPLLETLDQVIISNLQGTNFGLYHIENERLRAFYEGQNNKTLHQGMASMKLMYASRQENKDDGNVLSLPTRHNLAS